jgi:hypothetical protein
MIVAFMLAVLGGFGAAALAKSRLGTIALAVASLAFLAESAVRPFPVNRTTGTPGYAPAEARLFRPARARVIYHEVARLPEDSVLAELPLGVPDFDARAMFYQTVHWRPLLNGYSGFFPPHYGRLAVVLSDVPRFPGPALDALETMGATHVLVHEGLYLDGRGPATTAALVARGATELYRGEADVLLRLP